MRQIVILAAAFALLAAGCRSGSAPDIFSDARWRTFASGSPGVTTGTPIELTVTEGAGNQVGVQTVEFRINLGRSGNRHWLPLRQEVIVDCAGGNKETEAEAVAGLLAYILWRAWGAEGDATVRIFGQEVIDCSQALKNARIADGVMRGSFEVKRAAFREEMNQGFAKRKAAHSGLPWKVEAVLLVTFDNTSIGRTMVDRKRYNFIHAAGVIGNWMCWTYPEQPVSETAPR